VAQSKYLICQRWPTAIEDKRGNQCHTSCSDYPQTPRLHQINNRIKLTYLNQWLSTRQEVSKPVSGGARSRFLILTAWRKEDAHRSSARAQTAKMEEALKRGKNRTAMLSFEDWKAWPDSAACFFTAASACANLLLRKAIGSGALR
jgi:hypothetical protein